MVIIEILLVLVTPGEFLDYIGGLVGSKNGGIITNSFATGSVSSFLLVFLFIQVVW